MKLKTHKGLSKRIKATGSKKHSKLVHMPQNNSHHLRTKHTARSKNRKEREEILSGKVQIALVKKFI
ncbi:MAG: 50S ribosomal protein L35 [bacterium]